MLLMSNTNYVIGQFFGIPVMKIENFYFLNNDELSYIKNLPFKESSVINGPGISASKNILKDNNFSNLRKNINEVAQKFIDETICVDNKFEMVQSWIARSKNTHHKHDHKNAIFSLVYYAQAKKATLSLFKDFNFITEAFNFDLKYKKFNSYNGTSFDFEVKTGDVILFPGNIMHSAKNHSEQEKIIVGANYFIRGNVGDDTDITSLTI